MERRNVCSLRFALGRGEFFTKMPRTKSGSLATTSTSRTTFSQDRLQMSDKHAPKTFPKLKSRTTVGRSKNTKRATAARVSSGRPNRPKRSAHQNHIASRGTKAHKIILLLKRPSGATLKAMMALTGWQAHSVRGFISGQLRKRLGLDVTTFERDGERVYTLPS